MRSFSEPSARNREPILAVLKRVFADRRRVLEIGSGTGQHAAYFSAELPHLVWQASDVAENLPDIRGWVSDPPPVERLFAGIGRLRPEVFALYGPFNYNGRHTSESNARFDAMLRERDPASGLRDIEALLMLAEREYLEKQEDIAMPANNRLLVFRRSS